MDRNRKSRRGKRITINYSIFDCPAYNEARDSLITKTRRTQRVRLATHSDLIPITKLTIQTHTRHSVRYTASRKSNNAITVTYKVEKIAKQTDQVLVKEFGNAKRKPQKSSQNNKKWRYTTTSVILQLSFQRFRNLKNWWELTETNGNQNPRNSCPKIQKPAYR